MDMKDTVAQRPAGKAGTVTVVAVTSMAGFIAFLDSTIVNIAFPSIHADFSSWSLESLSWIMNIYNIVFAALLIPAGRYADRFGRKLSFVVGLSVFAVTSLMCAVAPDGLFLIVFRGFQAVGAALIVPSALALLLPSFPENRRGVAVSLFAATAALAAGIGPALGGFLIDIADWRLVFAVNVPIGILTVVAAVLWLDEAKEAGGRRNPDGIAVVCSAGGFGLIALGIVKGNDWGWTDWRTAAALLAGVVLILVVARRCATHPAPLIEPRILADRTVAVASASTFVFAAAFYAYLLTNVLFLTSVWHYSTLRAGLAMTPAPLFSTLAARPAGLLYDRFGGRFIASTGAVLVGAGLLCYALLADAHADFPVGWLPGAIISGIGVGLVWPSLATGSVQGVTGERFATATAFNSALRQLGGVLGVAACVSYLSAQVGSNPLDSFHDIWLGAAVVCVVAAVIAVGLRRPRPADDAASVGVATAV
ncbi:MFS transporter [Nocardia spumae]|uniref:MFS transporter n=1 Tax=Nocardia spumae TaxID=2887190 RepID=UPI001D13D149|nr:MFS transporter [Nocardia spumae]